METRKVSSEVPSDLHSHVSQLARTHGTTVASLVEYGLKLAVQKLRATPRAAARLRKDSRYKGKD